MCGLLFIIIIISTSNGYESGSWPFGDQPTIEFPSKTPPSNFSIINVKDFGAKGDGKTDDTKSIQTAINNQSAREILYFPQGTYMISSPLLYDGGNGLAKRVFIYGESNQKSILKLFDNTKNFSDPNHPQAIMKMGNGVAQNFGNQIWSIV